MRGAINPRVESVKTRVKRRAIEQAGEPKFCVGVHSTGQPGELNGEQLIVHHHLDGWTDAVQNSPCHSLNSSSLSALRRVAIQHSTGGGVKAFAGSDDRPQSNLRRSTVLFARINEQFDRSCMLSAGPAGTDKLFVTIELVPCVAACIVATLTD
ncbi:hypothetical protein BDA96_03G049500 [Sorghum bicolor]|jgi:hypothetical protein|uniref:Uncharacterized protein n=2 Tax=Sorghum bicolor TaxID=4558 RepID=A0A921R9P4_SORBI|nr:hypothetical protein BDA96_03G049500 [Sorghum bicolor]KXG31715.1 hypothetical protein SORBI_3003G046000 [Sorghum bicolor]